MIIIFKSKAIATLTLLAMTITGAGSAIPAMAEDTAPVAAAQDTASAPAVATQDTAPTTAVAKATSTYHIDTFTMKASVENKEGTLYLPLTSVLNLMGAEVTANPDNQSDRLKLTFADGAVAQLYLTNNNGGKQIATTKDGVQSPVVSMNGLDYVPMAFIQSLTNRIVSVYHNTLLLITVDQQGIWKPLDAYSVQPVSPVLPQAAAGSSLVNTAASCLGVPYVWGGMSMSGFDCSGLTSYVYARNGIALPRTAAAQQAAATPISFDQLQPGDLVFWGKPAHHVGIYIGDGQYIHAPVPGQVVSICNTSWYPFTSAGRISA